MIVPVSNACRFSTYVIACAVFILVTSAAARAEDAAAALERLQSETGLHMAVPDGLKEEVKEDGELQLTDGEVLFVAMQAMDGLDEAMSGALEHLRKIDKNLVEAKNSDLDDKDVKARAARGTLKIDGKETEWLVLGFNAGKKTLRVVMLGHQIKDNKRAESLVTSIKKL